MDRTDNKLAFIGEWYQNWVDTARGIVWQTLRESRMALIKGKWMLGEHIESHIKDFNRSQIYKERISQKIADDIGVTIREINRCRQFYKYCIKEFEAKDWDTVCPNLPEEQQISWHKIVQNYLPEPKENKIPLPEGKYSVILADPPWPYPKRQDIKNLYGNTDYHYETMEVDKICEMKVSELAGENSVLFLWVATNFLEESFEIIKNWGFDYKSQMVWVKEGGKQGGIGWYFWGDHEILLVATKGSMLPKEKFSSVLRAPRREHSKKPDEIYEIIEKMYPNTKKLELFARGKPRKGWQTWGDETDNE